MNPIASIGKITAGYGSVNPTHVTPHTGIDFSCPIGTEIHAPFYGVVSKISDYGTQKLGKAVFVTLPDGKRYVIGHLSKVKVHMGEVVHKGDLLAWSGNSGHSTAPHLHFGVFDMFGRFLDPCVLLGSGKNIAFSYFHQTINNHADFISNLFDSIQATF